MTFVATKAQSLCLVVFCMPRLVGEDMELGLDTRTGFWGREAICRHELYQRGVGRAIQDRGKTYQRPALGRGLGLGFDSNGLPCACASASASAST